LPRALRRARWPKNPLHNAATPITAVNCTTLEPWLPRQVARLTAPGRSAPRAVPPSRSCATSLPDLAASVGRSSRGVPSEMKGRRHGPLVKLRVALEALLFQPKRFSCSRRALATIASFIETRNSRACTRDLTTPNQWASFRRAAERAAKTGLFSGGGGPDGSGRTRPIPSPCHPPHPRINNALCGLCVAA